MSQIPTDLRDAARELVECASRSSDQLFIPELIEDIAVLLTAERERCAKIAADFRHPNPFPTVYGAIAAAIRQG